MDTEIAKKSWLGIREKLLLGFGAITLLLIVIVSVTLLNITKTEDFSKRVSSIDLPSLNSLIDLNSEILNSQITIEKIILNRNISSKDELLKTWGNISTIISSLDDASKYWKQNTNDWFELKSLIEQLRLSQLNIVNTINNNQSSSAEKILLTVENPLLKNISTKLNNIVSINETEGILDRQTKNLDQDLTQILSDLNQAKLIEYGLLLLAIVSALVIALWTARKIILPLKSSINIAKQIAAGKRDIKIIAHTNDETGELLNALDSMQNSIITSENKLKENEIKTRELFDEIIKSAKLFSNHSSRVAAGDFRKHLDIPANASEDDIMVQLGKDLNTMTENLASITNEIIHSCTNMVSTLEETRHAVEVQSSGAAEQASSINEITASIGEIEKSSTQTMEKAKMLGEIAQRTQEQSLGGLESVEKCVQGMKAVRDKVQLIAQTILDLSNQSQQVGEITAAVNNLAQQSKMLALNASIEAAKAGEAGKGFAVVAVEVKNLAEQSEQSTAQVQKILENIRHSTEKAVMVTEEGTKEVDNGMHLVEQTGDIIRSLNEVIHETTIASQQIEAAIRQESAGIEQITVGMNEINQVTASFVDSVKQSSEAMNNLSSISINLKQRVDTYKI